MTIEALLQDQLALQKQNNELLTQIMERLAAGAVPTPSDVPPASETQTPAAEATDDKPKAKRKRRTKKEIEADKAAEAAEQTEPANDDLPAATTTPAPMETEECRRELMKIVGRLGGPAKVLPLIHKRAPELAQVPESELPALLAEAQELVA